MTTLQEQMIELQRAVYGQEYYPMLYTITLMKHEMSCLGVELQQYSDAKIIDMANDFWLCLPDSPEVRTGPFWLLCEIAEHCFD